MSLRLIVLTKQILAVVVAIRRAHDDMDVLPGRGVRIGGEMP